MMGADGQIEKMLDAVEEAVDKTIEAADELLEEYAETEVVELEIDEDDILYYITDQDDNEIGFAIMEDGKEVEYFYVTDEDYHIAEVLEDVYEDTEDDEEDDDEGELLVEMEINDDDILYYLVDEDDNEIGFAIMEDGKEVEYYYVDEEIDVAADADADDAEPAAENAPAAAADEKEDDKDGALFTAEEIADFKDDVVELLKDGASIAKDLKSTYDEFSEALDFLPIKKKHR